jgi:hypothetical protein
MADLEATVNFLKEDRDVGDASQPLHYPYLHPQHSVNETSG